MEAVEAAAIRDQLRPFFFEDLPDRPRPAQTFIEQPGVFLQMCSHHLVEPDRRGRALGARLCPVRPRAPTGGAGRALSRAPGSQTGLAGAGADAGRRVVRSLARAAFRLRCSAERVVRRSAACDPDVSGGKSDDLNRVLRRCLKALQDGAGWTRPSAARFFVATRSNSRRDRPVTWYTCPTLNFLAGNPGALVSICRFQWYAS